MKSRVFEGISAGICVAAFWLAAIVIPTLPATVPSHFTLNGTPDRTGPAAELWALPAMVLVLYADRKSVV